MDYPYDVALSFAGEDREYVEAVAARLQAAGVRVFYDRFEEANLWGKDLYSHLDEVYRRQARYCVVFISRSYARKSWTNHERQSAQARAFEENQEYLLPARFDDTEIPGVRPTMGYVDLRRYEPAALGDLILQKLGRAVGTGIGASPQPAFRLPRVERESFNPYEEAGRLIRHLAVGLQARAQALADRGVAFSKFERDGRTCLRVLRNGKTRYSLDVWMGGTWSDDSVAFAFQTGPARFQSSNSMNAWGSVRWSKTRDLPVIPFVGFLGSGQIEQEYTFDELLDLFWNEICDALEDERR